MKGARRNGLKGFSARVGALCSLFLVLLCGSLFGQVGFWEISGKVRDRATGAGLSGATVSVREGVFSTVSNAQGDYRLVLPDTLFADVSVRVSHLGYAVGTRSVSRDAGGVLHFDLKAETRELGAVRVRGGDALPLVRLALSRVGANYPGQVEGLVGFYRESVRRGDRYVSLVEAVLGIRKAGYGGSGFDQARLHVGRRASALKSRDTVLLSLQGGVSTALLLDVVKNPTALFDSPDEDYTFFLTGLEVVDGRAQHVVRFSPRERRDEELQYEGELLIDTLSYALRGARFRMRLADGSPATSLIVRRLPARVRMSGISASYVVDYRLDGGVSRLARTRIELAFTCKRRFSLFSRRFTVVSELAITGRSNLPLAPIPRADRIRSTDIIAERVEAFRDESFWDGYTTIAPDESIREAVRRLGKRMGRF